MTIDISTIKFTEYSNEQGLIAYDVKEIEQKLGKDLFPIFQKWFAGKTGIIIKDKFCVYPHDWELWVYLRLRVVNKNK